MGLLELADAGNVTPGFQFVMENAPIHKFIRVGTQYAWGVDGFHDSIAQKNGLETIKVDGRQACHDGGRILVTDKNKIIVYDRTTTLQYATEDGIWIREPKPRMMEAREFVNAQKEYDQALEQARRITCNLLIAVANVLPSHPEIFYTTSPILQQAVLYQG